MAMADPYESVKINRLRKELSRSNYLTEVDDDFHLFEAATNKHFNAEMNKEVIIDRSRAQSTLVIAKSDKKPDESFARIKSQLMSTASDNQAMPTTQIRYDRMARRDFSRKI